MKSLAIFFSLTIAVPMLQAQNHSFEFGKISNSELDMKRYDNDTSAVAVVLNEFGEAFFDMENLNKIIFQYHIKIKVLREGGKRYADFEIPMRKNNGKQETVQKVKAISLNRIGNERKESTLLAKNIFTENVNEYYSLTKFAVPGVQVGSVIEISYELETPFTYNFVPWEFQSEIPKIKSEFWAKYPAYYDYGITLKGFLKLTKNEGQVVRECVGSRSTGYGLGGGADCTLFKYGMDNIPAFKEEDYMTAKKNFVSAISFELSKITQLDGRVDKITTEWKDAELELKRHDSFGAQIKKASNIFEEKVKELKLVEQDPLALAKSIHDYIKNNFSWNGDFGKYADNGVKETLETKKGNVGDINLLLLGALQEARLEAEPVLLSTRANGLPIQHHPVLSDFNYVLVRLNISDKYYFLDATSPLYPFGFIPERCLNGQGRALGETSAWIDLKPVDKNRVVTDLKLRLNEDGITSGTASINHYGYAAYETRNLFFGSNNEEEFIQKRTSEWLGLEVKNFNTENEKELEKPFNEKFELKIEAQTGGAGIVYFQPFILNHLEKNPFASTERLYPVDFGPPTENIYVLTFEYPLGYEPEELPKNFALSMPQGGGRYLFNVTKLPGKISFTSSLSLNKSVYTSDEYHALKEIFSRFISAQQSQIVMKKK